jgi:transcriptional/translational regulatory protein YebC/TACO1
MSAEIEMVPQNMTKLTDPKHIENMEKLIENLEDLDDVQNIFHNWDVE